MADPDVGAPLQRPGLTSSCVSCEKCHPADAKFCRECGEMRNHNRQIDIVFNMYTGSRKLFRRMDLTRFFLQARQLQQASQAADERTYRRLVSDIRQLYDRVLVQQSDQGETVCSQGFTPESFQTFLSRVAGLLGMRGTSLLAALLEEAGEGPASDFMTKPDDCEAHRAVNAELLISLGKCVRCQSKMQDCAKFCRHCGCSRPRSSKSVIAETEIMLHEVARKNMVPIDEVLRLHLQFKDYDVNDSGLIDKDEFEQLLRDQLGLTAAEKTPLAALQKAYLTCDRDASREVDFEEFLLWMGTRSATEKIQRARTKSVKPGNTPHPSLPKQGTFGADLSSRLSMRLESAKIFREYKSVDSSGS